MSKVLDIQRLSLQLIRPGDQVLHVVYHCSKYLILVYGDKWQFIYFPIGSQAQQVSVTLNSIWPFALFFWYYTSDSMLGK